MDDNGSEPGQEDQQQSGDDAARRARELEIFNQLRAEDPIPETDLYQYAYEIGTAGSFATKAFRKIARSRLSEDALAAFVDAFAAEYAESFLKKRRTIDGDPAD